MTALSQQISAIQTKINDKSNFFINIKNAVKILEVYSNWNGYTKLYTEVESNFLVNDIVYITCVSTGSTSNTFNLQNSDIPYSDFSMGYTVLYTNPSKNEIVINRLFNDIIPTGFLLKNQYLSKISCKNGSYYGGTADGAVFFQCDVYSGLTFTQGVFEYCNLSNITFNDKYSDSKTILTTNTYNSKFSIKSATSTSLNYSNSYYNKIENCNLYNCNVENGMFNNSTFNGNLNSNYIKNGDFYNCIISGYTISGGHFYNCKIYSQNNWQYGFWDNTNGYLDFQTTWNDGVWNRGNFNGIWSGGTFNNGTFTGLWMDGIVNNGTFSATTWLNGLVRNGTFVDGTIWKNGIFNAGTITNCIWSGGTFNGGSIFNSIIRGGVMNSGLITGCTIYDFNVNGSVIKNSTILNGKIYSISTYESSGLNVLDGSFYGGYIKQSSFSGGSIYNGIYANDTINPAVKIYNGTFTNSRLSGSTIYNGNFTKCVSYSVKFNYGIYSNGEMYESKWYDGYWNDGIFSGRSLAIYGQDDWYDGHFYGGYFWGNDVSVDRSFHGGFFHYGWFNGVYMTQNPNPQIGFSNYITINNQSQGSS